MRARGRISLSLAAVLLLSLAVWPAAVAAADADPNFTVAISPLPSPTVSGTVRLKVISNPYASQLAYRIDGSLVGLVMPPTPTFTWDSTTVANGVHELTVIATDDAGRSASATTALTVQNPVPSVSILTPSRGADLSAHTKVSVIARGEIRLRAIRVYAGTTLVGAVPCRGTSCFGEITWVTAQLPVGRHTISAVAIETSGIGRSRASVDVNKR